MSAQHKVTALDPAMQRLASEAAWTPMFVDAARRLLNTPMGDPGHHEAIRELKALVIVRDKANAPSGMVA